MRSHSAAALLRFAILTAALLVLPAIALACDETDAVVLALEANPSLTPDPTLMLKIDSDLALIRAAFPAVADIHATPEHTLDSPIVQLSATAFAQFQAGTYTGLDALNAQYGPVSVCSVMPSVRYLVLCFTNCYNTELLGPIYEGAEGVEAVYPNGIPGYADDITVTSPGTYTFSHGWGDCPAGCIHRHFWVFAVEGGRARLLEEYGDPLEGVGEPPLVRPSPAYNLAPAHPNPFNPRVELDIMLAVAGHAQLIVLDAAGHRVRTLLDESHEAGALTLHWDGRDDAGRSVASGLYRATLRVDDGPWVQRSMTLVR